MPAPDFNLRRILVATDFSEPAGAALKLAVCLAERTGAEIIVVHAIAHVASAVAGTSFEFHWRIPPAEIAKAERQLRRQAQEQLDEHVAPFLWLPRKPRTEVAVGVPFVEIIRLAQKRGCDLVMAGTRGLSGVKRFLVGSTAERLVRKCPCPVWIVHSEHERPPRSILAAVDFSEVSGKSLKLAAHLASLFDGSLSVLHVVSSPTEDTPRLPEASARMDLRLQRRLVRRALAQRLSEFVRAHVPEGRAVDERLSVGTPWQRIEMAARRVQADLLVLGSVGRTGIPGFFIGNTAEKVLRHCDRSILAVKPDGFVSPVGPAP
jgi:nucleotide-binding universal stress UspA family protein